MVCNLYRNDRYQYGVTYPNKYSRKQAAVTALTGFMGTPPKHIDNRLVLPDKTLWYEAEPLIWKDQDGNTLRLAMVPDWIYRAMEKSDYIAILKTPTIVHHGQYFAHPVHHGVVSDAQFVAMHAWPSRIVHSLDKKGHPYDRGVILSNPMIVLHNIN